MDAPITVSPEQEEVEQDSAEYLRMEGYVKVWRRLMKSAVWEDTYLLKVFVWALFRANYKARKVLTHDSEGEIELKRGEFICGRKKAANELKMNEYKVRRCIKTLEACDMLHTSPHSRFSVISVVNYETYQGNGIDDAQEVAHVPHTSRTHPAHIPHTDKKDKKVKKEKKKEGVAFAPPSVSEVLDYMRHIQCPSPERNAEKFIAHYGSNGWKQNKGKPIVDWRSAAVGWKIRQEEWAAEKKPNGEESSSDRAKRIAQQMKGDNAGGN